MKNYLKIQSAGEIELGAFTLIGASTKRGDSGKIGYYGSGLKYSISALLRNNIAFKVFAGIEEVVISTETQSFRSDSFEMITVNGNPTSLTTNMGGTDWDRPFAPIREIYSNALDEDTDAILGLSANPTGELGKTTFYIEMTESVTHFYDNVHLYFCTQNENVLAINEWGALYESIEKDYRLFRKGILCDHDSSKKALFHYNSNHFLINESRVLTSSWGAQMHMGKFWKNVKDKKLIKELLTGLEGGNSGYWEHEIDWDYDSFSDEWLEVCSQLKFVPAEVTPFASEDDLKGRMILPLSLLRRLNRQFDDMDILGLNSDSSSVSFIPKKNVSQILVNKVIDAVSLLRNTRYVNRMEDGLDITYVTFTKESVLGYANEGKIYLSVKLDTYDVNAIAKIIIEENEHNRTGFNDETREFQNHLFNLFFEELTR